MRTHRTSWPSALLTLMALVVIPTLVSAQEPAEDRAEAVEVAAALPPATVTVANHNWLDMHVYLVRASGGRTSLGMVTSQQTRRFEIPDALANGPGDLHLIADPIGSSRRYVSPAFFADPGIDVAVHLQAALNLSSASLRSGGVR